jgi:hypothetical protein
VSPLPCGHGSVTDGCRPVLELVAVRCSFCSKERPAHRVHHLTNGQIICDYCMEWHRNAMDVLSGGVPRGCQECGATWEFLRDSTLGVEVRMYVVPKDGIYQLLCSLCVAKYLQKVPHLNKGTRFGCEVLKI